ncbi:MAG: DoxX family protein [Chitinophagales bacterium]
MQYIILLGRILFVSIFFATLAGNFNAEKAKNAAVNGLPFASLLVPLSSVMAFIGSASVLLGIYAQYGAWLLIIFLLPVTFIQHKFWTIEDPMKRRGQYINFLKNLGLIGGALFIVANGSGPLSIDRLF